MTTVIGRSAKPDSQRRVAGELLQEEDEEEREGREPGVDGERLEVREGEVAAREEAERQHRLARAVLPPEERREQRDAADERHDDQRDRPAAPRLLDQREDRPAEPEHAEDRADEVDMRPLAGRARASARRRRRAPPSRSRTGR